MFNNRNFLIESDEMHPLSDYETTIIEKYLRICNEKLGHSKLYFCDEMKKRNINAAFVQYRPNCIFLNKPRNPFDLIPKNMKLSKTDIRFYENAYEQNLMQIVPYICHELIHKEQFKHYGRFLYGIYCLPYLYPIMLDNIAFENERKAAIDLRLDVSLYGKPK